MSRWRQTCTMPSGEAVRRRVTTWNNWPRTCPRRSSRRVPLPRKQNPARSCCCSARCITGSNRLPCWGWPCAAWDMTSPSHICPTAITIKKINAFDLRRQDLYTRRVLAPLSGLVNYVSLFDVHPAERLPLELEKAVETASAFDTMYTLQVEDFDRQSQLYKLRLERNHSRCFTGIKPVAKRAPRAVLIPNGLVTELGVFYQVARHLESDDGHIRVQRSARTGLAVAE